MLALVDCDLRWMKTKKWGFSGPEMYIFPATEDGECKSYDELEGSYRGGLDHAEALRRAGYEAVHAALPQ